LASQWNNIATITTLKHTMCVKSRRLQWWFTQVQSTRCRIGEYPSHYTSRTVHSANSYYTTLHCGERIVV